MPSILPRTPATAPTHAIIHTVTVPVGCTVAELAATLRQLPTSGRLGRIVLGGETETTEIADLRDAALTFAVTLSPE